jgi:nucleotide-binding universal stress UspA family protein
MHIACNIGLCCCVLVLGSFKSAAAVVLDEVPMPIGRHWPGTQAETMFISSFVPVKTEFSLCWLPACNSVAGTDAGLRTHFRELRQARITSSLGLAMLLLKHILVATDFCPISTIALRHALGIARRCQSEVSLLHVIDAPFYGLTPDGVAAAVECAERDAEQLGRQLEGEGLLHGLTLDVTITVGSVWPAIRNAIYEKNAGLLVLGTHGRSGLGKFVLGSVAESAFREAPCPVLTVGPKLAKSKSSGDEAKHFIVPTDLSPESTNALRYGISLARAVGGDVLLLHVLNLRNNSNAEPRDPAGQVKARMEQFLNEHPEAASMVSSRVEFGDPARVIVKVAEQTRADLIVMGVRAWSTDGPPMWQTAYEVLVQARCPVLTMKAPALSASEPKTSTAAQK